jgi:arylsulfatase A-like enzyme
MKHPSISVIVLDTMRLDEFQELESKYRQFERLGFGFLDNCIAPSTWTLPSHASLFTGMYPHEHGAHETQEIKWLDIDRIKLTKSTFLPELSSIGYKTYAISANPYVHPIYGFDEFDNFKEESYFTDVFGHPIEIPQRLRSKITPYRERYGKSVGKIAFAIMKEDPNLLLEAPAVFTATLHSTARKLRAKFIDGWPIEKGGKNIVKTVAETKFKTPYFLFINMMEPHDPYVGVKGKDFTWATPFLKSKPSKDLVAQWVKLYTTASTKAYKYAVQVVETLIKNYGDNQVFMITSDHGQAFGEHGFIGHGTVLYDEIIKIPMAVKLPGITQIRKRKEYSSLVNVKSFVHEVIRPNGNPIDKLYSKTIYAESFGVPANVSMLPGIDKAKLKAYDKPIHRKFS